MARRTEWYTPYQNVGPRVQAPDRNYAPRGGRRGGIYDLLGQQAQLRAAVAREQLRQMKDQGKRARESYASETQGRYPRERRRMAAMSDAEKLSLLRSARKGAAREGAAQENVMGEAMRGSAFAPRDYRDYNRVATLNRFMPGGVSRFSGVPLAGMDAMNRARLDAFSDRRLEPNYYGAAGVPGGGEEYLPGYNTGLPTDREGQPGSVSSVGRIRSHADGTLPGTVPKTGPANIHEGEAVVSADQVDEPLMRYLMADKMKKMESGQMDGKGTGPGKDMQSYQGGSYGPPANLFDDPSYSDEDILPGGGGAPDGPGWLDVDPSRWTARALGEAFRRPFQGADEVLGGIGEFFGGVAGTEAPPSPEAVAGAPTEPLPMEGSRIPPGPYAMPELEGELGQAGEDIYQRSLAETQGRVAAGDYGSPGDPLTLSGGARPPGEPRADAHLPEEEQYFNPESQKWREAQDRKVERANRESELMRLQGYMVKNAGQMDRETFKSMSDKANQMHQAIQMDKTRDTEREKHATELQAGLQKAMAAYESASMKANVEANAKTNQELIRSQREVSSHFHKIMTALTGDPDMPDESREVLIGQLGVLFGELRGGDPQEYAAYLKDIYGL